MSGVPPSLATLRGFLHTQTGLPFVSLGVVGDTKHVRGYHLGRDRIYDGSGPGIGDADYSVQTHRDKAGLSDFASAIDVGMFPRLRAMSIWLVDQARHDAPDMRDFREIIYSDDGIRVLRWDRERGFASAPRTGEADSSHTTHSHFSTYRDSHSHDVAAAFRRFFAPKPVPVPGPVSEASVKAFPVYEKRAYVGLRLGAKLYQDTVLGANGLMIGTAQTIIIDPARDVVYVGSFSDKIAIVAYEKPTPDADAVSTAMFVHKSDLTGAPRFVDDLTEAARKQIRQGAFHDATESIARLA